MCNAAVRVFSDVHSENSSLAGSEQGCEKLKKPQQSTKTEPDGVKKHEGNFGKSKKAALSVREGGEQEALLLLPEFVSEKTQRTQLVKNTEVCVFKTAEVNFRAEGLGFFFFLPLNLFLGQLLNLRELPLLPALIKSAMLRRAAN